MSKLFENDLGLFISHEDYINSLYKDMDKSLAMNPKLFSIKEQYKSHKTAKKRPTTCEINEDLEKEKEFVKLTFTKFMTEFLQKHVLEHNGSENKDALETAEFVYNESGKAPMENAHGENNGPAISKNLSIGNSKFVFPQNCRFFSKDIAHIENYLKKEQYDLILLDPPWWNKYIRRKRKKSNDAYKMLINSDIQNLPVESLLKDNGMVIVWCTNSQQNLNSLLTEIFPKWNVKYIGMWYWIKVTLKGEPVCPFSVPPGKQPYERIIFGCRGNLRSIPTDKKLVGSVPSAIHSHKPPLIELVKEYLPENPSCLEIFARYLLPNWTSYGNEVLRLQHESMFVEV